MYRGDENIMNFISEVLGSERQTWEADAHVEIQTDIFFLFFWGRQYLDSEFNVSVAIIFVCLFLAYELFRGQRHSLLNGM